MFLSERMFLSANADFASLCVVYVSIPFRLQKSLNAPLNSVPLSDHTFLGFVIDVFLANVFAVSSAVLDRIGSTRNFRDNTSTATSKYLTPLFYLASLST